MSETKISEDQIKRLAEQSGLGISATLFNSTILAIVLMSVIPKGHVLIWLLGSFLVNLGRLILYGRNRRKPMPAGRVKKVLLLLLCLSGCIWGLGSICLFPYASLAHQVLMAFVLGGMVAGSVGVFASIMAAFYCFSIPTITPIIIIFFTIGDGMHYGMGIMMMLFWFLMFMSAKRMNHEIRVFFNLKYENLDLITDLEDEIRERKCAQEMLQTRNQEIESIVAARTAELRQVNQKLIDEIDDRREAENALRKSEEKYRELANSLPQIVFETDIQGRVTFANRNAYAVFGYTEDDVKQGLSAFDIFVPEQRDLVRHNFQQLVNWSKPKGKEFLARKKDGAYLPVDIHSTPVIVDGQPVGIRGIIIDLTRDKQVQAEQKKLQAQLQHAQKMEFLGLLAGGVAHDLNNILAGIVSYPDLMLMQVAMDSPLRAPLLTMQESGKKAAAIVQDLLTFARRGVKVEEVLDLNDVIAEYLQSPEHRKLMAYHPGVVIDYSFEKELHKIMGSRVHLSKSVMNLISNAAEAMPDGGRISVTTCNRYLAKSVKSQIHIPQGDYVALTITDTGIGISPSDSEKIFEPFFTKKVMGRSGTGLGMAVVWNTVKDHEGYIEVISSEGQGATFVLFFPATQKKPSLPEVPEPAATYQGHGEHLLIVDDIKEQRLIATDMLKSLGYRVSAVSSGEEALSFLKSQRVDLIVLDMIMDPGADGLDTYQSIIRTYGDQKAVLTSGFSETPRVKRAQEMGAGPYLKKPYTLSRLGQVVHEALIQN